MRVVASCLAAAMLCLLLPVPPGRADEEPGAAEDVRPADEGAKDASILVAGRAFRGARDWVRCLAFHPESGLLFAGSADRCLRLWDVATGDLAREVRIPRRLGGVP